MVKHQSQGGNHSYSSQGYVSNFPYDVYKRGTGSLSCGHWPTEQLIEYKTLVLSLNAQLHFA